jgi:hypothetical protein
VRSGASSRIHWVENSTVGPHKDVHALRNSDVLATRLPAPRIATTVVVEEQRTCSTEVFSAF